MTPTAQRLKKLNAKLATLYWLKSQKLKAK